MEENFKELKEQFVKELETQTATRTARALQELENKKKSIQEFTALKLKILNACRNNEELALFKKHVLGDYNLYFHTAEHALVHLLSRALNTKLERKVDSNYGLSYTGYIKGHGQVCVYGEMNPPGCTLRKVTKMVPKTTYELDCGGKKNESKHNT